MFSFNGCENSKTVYETSNFSNLTMSDITTLESMKNYALKKAARPMNELR